MTQYHGTDPNGAGGYSNPWGNRFAVWGESYAGEGVIGTSGIADGVWGATNGPVGFGVFGMGAVGVGGSSRGVSGVAGYSYNETGVLGEDGGTGDGLWGKSNSGQGVNGESTSGYGIFGYSEKSDAITGFKDTADAGAAGSFLSAQLLFVGRRIPSIVLGKAGTFWGHVDVNGNLTVSGSKGFKIDHPLDPAQKFLYHSSVESPDMKNIYDGIAVLDRRGQAIILLPEWFGALNKDFRYQLTPIGVPAPDLHIAEGIRANQFRIAGGKPKMKVSWQVSGIRQDPWANTHRLPVEEKKRENRGRYLHPDLYKKVTEKDILSVLHLDAARPLQRIRKIKELAAERASILRKMARRSRAQRNRSRKSAAQRQHRKH